MGNGLYYGLDGREKYFHDGTVITDSRGKRGKVVTEIGDTEYHSSLPRWSKKSEIYFKRNDRDSHPIEQMRVFRARKASLDFDWGHTHKEFPEGTVHVHEWRPNNKGDFSRSKHPRFMTPEEIERYGELIRRAAPGTKLKP